MPILSIPALIPAPGGAALALADGSTRAADIDEARALVRSGEVLVAQGTPVQGVGRQPYRT